MKGDVINPVVGGVFLNSHSICLTDEGAGNVRVTIEYEHVPARGFRSLVLSREAFEEKKAEWFDGLFYGDANIVHRAMLDLELYDEDFYDEELDY